MEDPSGEGKGLRSRSVMRVFLKEARVLSARAVERPKTPEPTIRIEEGRGAMGLVRGGSIGLNGRWGSGIIEN